MKLNSFSFYFIQIAIFLWLFELSCFGQLLGKIPQFVIPVQNYAVIDISGSSVTSEVQQIALDDSNNIAYAFGTSGTFATYYINTWNGGVTTNAQTVALQQAGLIINNVYGSGTAYLNELWNSDFNPTQQNFSYWNYSGLSLTPNGNVYGTVLDYLYDAWPPYGVPFEDYNSLSNYFSNTLEVGYWSGGSRVTLPLPAPLDSTLPDLAPYNEFEPDQYTGLTINGCSKAGYFGNIIGVLFTESYTGPTIQNGINNGQILQRPFSDSNYIVSSGTTIVFTTYQFNTSTTSVNFGSNIVVTGTVFDPVEMNDNGVAIGSGTTWYSSGGISYINNFLWNGQSLSSLNLLIASGLNNQGQVVGTGTNAQHTTPEGVFLNTNDYQNPQFLIDKLPTLAKGQIHGVRPWMIANQMTSNTCVTVFSTATNSTSTGIYLWTSGTGSLWTIAQMQLPTGTGITDYAAINSSGLIAATGNTSWTAGTNDHALLLLPIQLINKADPYAGSSVIGTPSHNGQDTPIILSSTANPTNINSVAWIAASDTTQAQVVTGVYPPRMPQLQVTVGGTNGVSGLTVCWKLSVINHGLHGPTGNPYRDFDTGASLTSAQISQLTNVNETSTTGYSDDIAIPLPTNSQDSNTQNGWVQITGSSTWNIYQDPDWQAAVARGFFGGDAVLSLKILDGSGNTIMPEQDYNFRIAGENPTADPITGVGYCQTYINTTYNGPAPNWTGLTFTSGSIPPTVPGYWFAYAVAKEETSGNGKRPWYNQFLDNGGLYNNLSNSQPVPGKEGYPSWNDDPAASPPGTGGYGLFQLTYSPSQTNFIMPRDWIWNWQSNVKQFLPMIRQKLQDAQDSVNRTKNQNPSFTDPSSLTTTADTTTFNFWESTVITRYNSGRGWFFSPGSNGQPGTWSYRPNSQNYLFDVARKGIENHQ